MARRDRRSRITASAPTARRDRTNYRMKQADGRRRAAAAARRLHGLRRQRAAYEDYTLESGTRRARRPIEDVFTPATAPGLGASPSYLHTVGIGRHRLAAGSRLRASRRAVPRSRITTTRTATTPTASIASTARSCSTFPILRENWVISLHGLVQTTLRRRRHGAVLPAAVARQRQHAARLQQLALPRSPQPADVRASGAGSPSRLALDMAIFYDAGKVASRRERSQPAPPASATSASASASTARSPRRCASSWRTGDEGHAARVRRRRGVLTTKTTTMTSRTTSLPRAPPPSAPRWPSPARRRREPAASSTTTIPIAREPETQDASKVAPWDIDLFVDLAINLFGRPGDSTADVRAQSINTIDEVPDSIWFTNRIGTPPGHDRRSGRAVRSPATGPAPGRWTVSRAKEAGAAPGFTMRDTQGRAVVRLVRRRRASRGGDRRDAGREQDLLGARLLAGRELPDHVTPGPARHRLDTRSSRRRPASAGRCGGATWTRSSRAPIAAPTAATAPSPRAASPARSLGGFRYHGTRPDDPNDVVPHEHRRELRALKVFGAWTNLVDMKAGNTLDTLITENGRGDGPALPAGRRLDLRHRRQRTARVRRGLGIPVRRRR